MGCLRKIVPSEERNDLEQSEAGAQSEPSNCEDASCSSVEQSEAGSEGGPPLRGAGSSLPGEMRDLHRYVAYTIPAGFLLLALWSLAMLIRNREPGGWFWHLLATLQVVIGVQFLIGGVLFLTGARPASNGPSWLHYVYGALFPALVLVVAHRRASKVATAPWLIFGVAALVCFGLTFRALQTGLGID